MRDFRKSDPLRAEQFAKLMRTFKDLNLLEPKVQLGIIRDATGVEYKTYSAVPNEHFAATLRYLGVYQEERPTA